MTVTERMRACGGIWICTNTDQQLADGLTQLTSRQRFAETLRRAWHALKFDPSFTAGKKVTAAKKQAQDDELNEAAANQEVFATEEVEELIQEVSAPTQVSRRSGKTVLVA